MANNNMAITKNIAIIILLTGLQQCSWSQKKPANNKPVKMDSIDKKNNPVYSNTDTSKVEISEEEWKKI